MMKRLFGLIALAILLPTMLYAQAADTPLIIIRFQHPNVTYDEPLFFAVSQALQTNPDMRFHVVGVSTRGNSSDYAQRVASSMVAMGLPATRISVTRQQAADQRSPEVQVFIQ